MPRRTKAILTVLGLAFLGMLVIFGHEPSGSPPHDSCPSMGIDPEVMREGTCEVGGSTNVVVDRGHTVRLKTLDARLLGVRQTTALHGREGTKLTKEAFLVFELAITNRTDSPQRVGENQVVLRGPTGQAVDAEEGFEPRSFLAAPEPIAPGATADGTVIFVLTDYGAEATRKEGNLDIADFGATGGDYEPEAIETASEVGVIRTYRKPDIG